MSTQLQRHFIHRGSLFLVLFVIMSLTLQASTKKVFVNEISGNDKWIEVYNNEDTSVDLSGYKIQKIDEEGVTSDWPIPTGTTISAKGFLKWAQDKDNTDGSTFTWGISAKKDVAFKIFDGNNDEVDFFEVKIANLYSDGNARTVGRKTDGASNLIVFIEGGTPAASNNNGIAYVPPTTTKKIFVNEISGNDKWLEIYNNENKSVDLSGYKIQKIDEEGLSDDWLIPAGTTIPAKGFLMWVQDKDNTDGTTFTWGISAKKDVAFKVFDDNNNELDFFEVKVANLYSDGNAKTVGRETDGASNLIIFLEGGTPAASNNDGVPYIVKKKIYVNEISGNDKWLEIYNGETEPIDLTGYKIQKIDENAATSDWSIPAGTTISAKGFLKWTQDKDNTDGSTFTWGISPTKDVAFKIFDNNGSQLDYFEVKMPDLNSEGNNKTVGRETDGAPKLVIFLDGGTPASTNDNGITENPVEKKKIYINEISGNDKWLEIYNGEANAVDLTGYVIQKIDEEGVPVDWAIPAGTTISAKGFLMWVQDKDNTDGTTFTWGISAKKDVAFKIFDGNGSQLDYFEVKMPDLISEGDAKTVGRKTDGAQELVIFLEGGTPIESNSLGVISGIEIETANENNLNAYAESGIIYLSENVHHVSVFNMSGNTIISNRVINSQTINLTHLPKGIYLLKISGYDKQVKIQKIMLN